MTPSTLLAASFLSEISYSSFPIGSRQGADLSSFLVEAELPRKLGEEFVLRPSNDLRVLSQTEKFQDLGFSAVVFQMADQRYLSIRGTQLSLFDLVIADALGIAVQGVAGQQAAALYRYWKSLTTPAGAPVQYSVAEREFLLDIATPGVISVAPGAAELLAFNLLFDRGVGIIQPGEKVIVTGHSLGGHLAQIFALMFPDSVEAVYTFNGAGVGGLAAQMAEALAPEIGVTVATGLPGANIIASHGMDFTAGFGRMYGPVERVFNEKSVFALNNHSISRLVDSLALYDLANVIDPGLSRQDIGRMLDAASEVPLLSLEVALKGLRTVLGGGSESAEALLPGDRNAYFTALLDLRDRLTADTGRSNAITVLAGLTPGELARLALDPARTDVRYALDRLDPFAVSGVDHALLLDPGHLQLDITGENTGHLTPDWIADRADLLAWVLARNEKDITGALKRLDGGVSVDYTWMDASGVRRDLRVQGDVALPIGQNRRVYFGGNDAEVFSGGSSNDRLYSMAGDDRLIGAGGDDHLEGGAGDDDLRGDTGNDALHGGAGNDRLEGGAGADRIEGGDGVDTYVLTAGDRGDVIVDSDGAGRVLIDGREITTAEYDDELGVFVTGDGDRLWMISSVSGVLSIDGIASIAGFESGDLGITLSGGPSPEAAPQISIPGERIYDSGTLFDAFERSMYNASSPGTYRMRYPAGSPFSDVFIAAAGQEVAFWGREGNDSLTGSAGEDLVRLYGGSGDDIVDGSGTGDNASTTLDVLSGGAGDDLILGGEASEAISGDVDRVFWHRMSFGPNGWREVLGIDDVTVSYGSDRPYPLVSVPVVLEPLTSVWVDELALIDDPGSYFANRFYGPVNADTPQDFADFVLGGNPTWNDWIDAGDGDNVVTGGPGDDWIASGSGDDVIRGDYPRQLQSIFNIPVAGWDWLRERLTAPGSDQIFSGAGDDRIEDWGGRTSHIESGEGRDDVWVSVHGPPVGDPELEQFEPGSLHADLGAGDDVLDGHASYYFVDGGSGHDQISLVGSAGTVFGGDGDDSIEIGTQFGLVRPGRGSDRISAAGGDGTLVLELGERSVSDQDWLELESASSSYTFDRDGDDLVLEAFTPDTWLDGELIPATRHRIEVRDWFAADSQRLDGVRFTAYDPAIRGWTTEDWSEARVTNAALDVETGVSVAQIEAVDPQIPEAEDPPVIASGGGSSPPVVPPGIPPVQASVAPADPVSVALESASLVEAVRETSRRAAQAQSERVSLDQDEPRSLPPAVQREIETFFERNTPAAMSVAQWIDSWTPGGARLPNVGVPGAGNEASGTSSSPPPESDDMAPEPSGDTPPTNEVAARYDEIDAWLAGHSADEETMSAGPLRWLAALPAAMAIPGAATGTLSAAIGGSGLRDLSGGALRPLSGLDEGISRLG